MSLSVALDLFPLLAALLAATACGLLGNFLVLRRQSLMGDAISHGVLPGLVIAFLVSTSRGPLPMLVGAASAGVATAALVELVKRFGRVEPGAAMGVVFSVLFALGVLLIEQAAARHVDLDADCVLHGQLETLAWYDAPGSWSQAFSSRTLAAAPRQVWMLAGALLGAILFVALLYKELRVSAFDPALATTQGFNASLLHHAQMVLVAAATVAAFEAVGSILVIAMLIVPAATARLLTDRLRSQLVVSLIAAIAAALAGYLGATAIPARFGLDSLSAAGSITVAGGAILGLAAFAGPKHGITARWLRRAARSRAIARDDLLAGLYRAAESGRPIRQTPRGVIRWALRRGLVVEHDGALALTDAGTRESARVIRSHRLWEKYLVDEAGLAPDHVHAPAEVLEHTSLSPPPAAHDPHGREIPPTT